jgi:serine protease Do
MNTNWKFSALTLAALFSLTAVSAQKTDKKEKDKKKTQTITIVRSGDSDEKITVEVVGDKVTVNGKPVEEYKGDVQVMTGAQDVFARPGRFKALTVPSAPMALSGLDGDHFFALGGNTAVLGISMENAEGGAKVTEVTKESAAEKAGLKVGDIITKIGDKAIEDADDVYEAIHKQKPEDKISITYKRDGQEATASATLLKNEDSFGHTFAMADKFDHDFNYNFNNGQGVRAFSHSRKPRLGLQIEDLEDGNGVKILEVNAETPAGKAGLQKDDVITSFNGKDVKGVDDLRNAMKDVKEGETVKVSYQRGGSTQTADIKFPKAVKKASL